MQLAYGAGAEVGIGVCVHGWVGVGGGGGLASMLHDMYGSAPWQNISI